MPPQVPLRRDRGRRHLFELLRPELVKSNVVPLSSDALSTMAKWDPQRLLHNEELKKASRRLFKDVIPQCAAKLNAGMDSVAYAVPKEIRLMEDAPTPAPSTNKRANIIEVLQAIHRAGINLRLLGFVRAKVSNAALKRLLLQEMIARVIKGSVLLSLNVTIV